MDVQVGRDFFEYIFLKKVGKGISGFSNRTRSPPPKKKKKFKAR